MDGKRVDAHGRGLLIEFLEIEMRLRGIDAPTLSASVKEGMKKMRGCEGSKPCARRHDGFA